jgi:hypothetical protein
VLLVGNNRPGRHPDQLVPALIRSAVLEAPTYMYLFTCP